MLSGRLLNDDKFKNDSGFQTILIDIDDKKGWLKIYNWNKNSYETNEGRELDLAKEVRKDFKIQDAFLNSLEEINIPLVIGDRKSIKLSDVLFFRI